MEGQEFAVVGHPHGDIAQWQRVRFACGRPRVQTPVSPIFLLTHKRYYALKNAGSVVEPQTNSSHRLSAVEFAFMTMGDSEKLHSSPLERALPQQFPSD